MSTTLLALTLAAGLDLSVPFVSQEKDRCASATLAMVLQHWGHRVTADQVDAAIPPSSERRGIPGSRLAAYARTLGLTAIAFEGDLGHLRDFLRRGRPLIVTWKLGRSRYHDVVVVGFDDDAGAIIVNDPALGPSRLVPLRRFEERWAGAGHWTLLVLPGPP